MASVFSSLPHCYSFSSCLRLAPSLRNLVTMWSCSLTRHSMPTGSRLRPHALQVDPKRRFWGNPPIWCRVHAQTRPNRGIWLFCSAPLNAEKGVTTPATLWLAQASSEDFLCNFFQKTEGVGQPCNKSEAVNSLAY